MKVVILAGGFGTRISEESHLKPKPMIEIGERPILWHIMKIYSSHGFNDFIICLGYKGYCIKEYFAHYFLHEADVTFDFRNKNERMVHHNLAEPWTVTLVNTGVETMTGGRVKRVKEYIGNETFMLTYGDGVADINIKALVDFHKSHGKLATVSSIQPLGRFGALDIDNSNLVRGFKEKPKGDGAWINGGFFVMEPSVLDYIDNDATVLEKEPLEKLAHDGQLLAFKHSGFWQPMDTLRDKNHLDGLWKSGTAPWKVW
jgi:glucose-1-phosphate cytidylyltransferase